MEERLERLETKIDFAEDMLDELNRTVFRQQEQIDRLKQQLSHLHEKMQSFGPVPAGDLRDEIPPHY